MYSPSHQVYSMHDSPFFGRKFDGQAFRMLWALIVIALLAGCAHGNWKTKYRDIGEPELSATTMDPNPADVRIVEDGEEIVKLGVSANEQQREHWEQNRRVWQQGSLGIQHKGHSVVVSSTKDIQLLPSVNNEIQVVDQKATPIASAKTDESGRATITLNVPNVPSSVSVTVGSRTPVVLDLSKTRSYCRSTIERLNGAISSGDVSSALGAFLTLPAGSCEEAQRLITEHVVKPAVEASSTDGGQALLNLLDKYPSARAAVNEAFLGQMRDKLSELIAKNLNSWTGRSTIPQEDYLGNYFMNSQGRRVLARIGSSGVDPKTGWNKGDQMIAPILMASDLGPNDVDLEFQSDRVTPDLRRILGSSLSSCLTNPHATVSIITPSDGTFNNGFGGPGYSALQFSYTTRGLIDSVDAHGGASSDADLAACMQRGLPSPAPRTVFNISFKVPFSRLTKLETARTARTCLAATVDLIQAIQEPVHTGSNQLTSGFTDEAGRHSLNALLVGLGESKNRALSGQLSAREVSALSLMTEEWAKRIDAVESRWGLSQEEIPVCMFPATQVIRQIRGTIVPAQSALSASDNTFVPQVNEAATWFLSGNPRVTELGEDQYGLQVGGSLVCEALLQRQKSGCESGQHRTWVKDWCREIFSPARRKYGADVTNEAVDRMCREYASFSGGGGPIQQYTGYIFNGQAVQISPQECVGYVLRWCR